MSNDLIKEYESLNIKDKSLILTEMTALEGRRLSGLVPTTEEMLKASQSTGHPELFLICYSAQLTGKKWYTRSGDRTRDTCN